MDAKQYLSEIFGFYKYKIDNNLCTPEEIDSAVDVAKNYLDLEASIGDLAKQFGVSEAKVRNTINRKMVKKPKRRVYYSFKSFLEIVPDKWIKEKNQP